jgi:hypothetical protein
LSPFTSADDYAPTAAAEQQEEADFAATVNSYLAIGDADRCKGALGATLLWRADEHLDGSAFLWCWKFAAG